MPKTLSLNDGKVEKLILDSDLDQFENLYDWSLAKGLVYHTTKSGSNPSLIQIRISIKILLNIPEIHRPAHPKNLNNIHPQLSE